MDNKKSIEKIPTIRQELIEAINQNKLVLFIGAGVSALTGLPLWNSLADQFIDLCVGEKLIKYDEGELIKNKISDAKQKLSVAYEFFKSHGKEDLFYSFLKDKLRVESVNEDAKTIFEFCRWTNSPVLTTNADLLLDEFFEKGLVFSYLKDFNFSARNALFKIHGSVDNPESLVFTAEQYLIRYNYTGFVDFLQSVFNSGYTVLFLGYGMSEFELLDYLVKNSGSKDNKIFYLAPFFEYELPYMTAMDLYYKSIGVELIPYSKSENGYRQLSIIIREWRKEIDTVTGIHEQKVKKLRELVSDVKNAHQIVQLVKCENYLENSFYNIIAGSDKLEEWIGELLNTDLFILEKHDPDKAFMSLTFINNVFNMINKKELFNSIKAYINETFKTLLSSEAYAKNNGTLIAFSSLLFKFDENVVGPDGIKALIELYQSSNFHFGVLVHQINNSSNIVNWDSDSLDILCIELINTLDTTYGNKTYWIREFYTKTFQSILDLVSYRVFESLINWIEVKEVQERDFHFLYLGAIGEDYSKDRFGKEVLYTIIEMCRQLIDDSFERFEQDYFLFLEKTKIEIEKETDFSETIKKLFIYLISQKYKKLKEYLFSLQINPFEKWELYGDLYLLIQKNNSAFLEEECQILYEWIISSTYNNKPEEYQKVIKYDFLDLLSQCHKVFDELKKNYYCERHDEYDSVFERNKPVRVTSFVGVDNEDLIEELKLKDFNEIVDYLKEAKPSFQHTHYDYENAFEITIKEKPTIILNNRDYLEKLPVKYFRSVIRSFSILKDFDETKALETLFLIGDIVLNNQQEYYQFNEIIEQLRKNYLEAFQIEKITVVESIVDFVKKILKMTQSEFERIFEIKSYDNFIIELINYWYSVGVHFLIEAAVVFQKNKVENTIINDILSNLKTKEGELKAVKIVLAYYLSYISVLVKDNMNKETIDIIIDNNDSIAAFLCQPFNNENVFIRIQELDYYHYAFAEVNMPDDFRFNLTKLAVFANLMFDISVNEEINLVIGCEGKKPIYYLFEALLESIESGDCDLKKAKELLDSICERLLLLEDLSSIQWYDLILKDLSKIIILTNSKTQIYWKLMVCLSENYETILSKELLDCLLENYSFMKQYVIDIVYNLTKSLMYFSEKEREKLFKIIEWVKDDPKEDSSFHKINGNLIKQEIYLFVDEK